MCIGDLPYLEYTMYFSKQSCFEYIRNSSGHEQSSGESFSWNTIPPVLILVGTLGNILSIVVLNRRRRFAASTSTYLSVLAVCDVVLLYTGLFYQWMRNAYHFDIRNINLVICKLHFFISSFSLQFSSWILVTVTFERLVSVWKPHIVKFECTKKLAVVVLVTEAFILTVINSHLLFGVTLVRHENGTVPSGIDAKSAQECSLDNGIQWYSTFVVYIWPWIEFCCVFFLPFLFLLFGNIVILLKIKKSRRFQREMINHQNINGRLKIHLPPPMTSLTATLLTLNSVFFVCVGPANIFNVGQYYWWPEDCSTSVQGYGDAMVTWAVVNILMYSYYSVNFLLYVVSGATFRAEVRVLLKEWCCDWFRRKYSSVPASQKSRLPSTSETFL